MAKNINLPGPTQPLIILDATVVEGPNGTSPVSGDPVLINGNLPGTAVADKDSVTGLTPVRVDPHVAEFAVVGQTAAGNAALTALSPLYMQSDGSIDGDSGGVPFGIAFGNSLDPANNALGTDTRTGNLVASGATTTIRVLVGVYAAVAAGSITFAKAKVFVSAEQTGNGSEQDVAHGLAAVPTKVIVIPTDLTASTVGQYAATQGTHDATNCKVTVTSGKKYMVLAWA